MTMAKVSYYSDLCIHVYAVIFLLSFGMHSIRKADCELTGPEIDCQILQWRGRMFVLGMKHVEVRILLTAVFNGMNLVGMANPCFTQEMNCA